MKICKEFKAGLPACKGLSDDKLTKSKPKDEVISVEEKEMKQENNSDNVFKWIFFVLGWACFIAANFVDLTYLFGSYVSTVGLKMALLVIARALP